jgi:purine-cytosine permease-like protein
MLTVSYFAMNDANLYGSINSMESLKKLPHKVAVAILAFFGCCMAVFLSVSGAAKGLEQIAALNCIVLPMPTVIMLGEWFVVTKIFGGEMPYTRVVSLDEVPVVRWPAVIALIAGCTLGIMTAGLIPACESLHVGISSVQSWIFALGVFIPLRLVEYRVDVGSRARDLERLFEGPGQLSVRDGVGSASRKVQCCDDGCFSCGITHGGVIVSTRRMS